MSRSFIMAKTSYGILSTDFVKKPGWDSTCEKQILSDGQREQILSKPVDIFKHTNPQVLTLLGEKLLCPFPAEENFRCTNKPLMEFALSGAKKSQC